MTQEALKLALEALEVATTPLAKDRQEVIRAITVIKEALAQEKALQALHNENERLGLYKDAYAQPEEEKLHPVHIGVDVTREGTAVTAFYRKPDAVMEMFYSQFHPMAQQEQEPVAWRTFDGEGGYDYHSYEDNESFADDWNKRNPNHKGWVDKLYTRSQPKQELTNIERHEANVQKFLGASQQPEQEPVAYLCKPDKNGLFDRPTPDKACNDCFPVFRALPQRTWVGLTDEEIEYVWRKVETSDFHDCVLLFAKELEAKLKQKNGYAYKENT